MDIISYPYCENGIGKISARSQEYLSIARGLSADKGFRSDTCSLVQIPCAIKVDDCYIMNKMDNENI